MLQTIHDKITGWIAGIVIVLIGVPFIFWGVDVGFGSVTYAAKVNGEEIDANEVRRVFQNQLNQYQQYTRSEIPAEMRTQLGNNLLEEFIRAELIAQHAQDRGYRVTSEAILKSYREIPAFQIDGQYSEEVAKRVLQGQGMSPAQFEAQQRRALQIAQVEGGIASSAFVTPAELARLSALEKQEREAAWAIVHAVRFKDSVEPDEAAIKDFYERNKTRFMTPETVTLRYVELRVGDVAAAVPVTEEALRAFYDSLKDRYVEPEKRRGRHILFQVGSDAEDAAARKKADEALARAKAGEDFSKLAKELSQDAGSAEQGGDLGSVERSFLVAPFADALFTMNVDEIRGPVRTQFGYHVIRLDAVQQGKQQSFEEVRAELEAEYRTQEAEKLFGERQEALATKAFESLDSLDPVAKDLGLEVRTIEGFTRSGGGPFPGNQDVIETAFSEAVLTGGENSELIEIEPGHVVVLRADNRKAATQKPLEAVRTEIVAELKTQRAREIARETGQKAVEKLEAGGDWNAVLAEAALAGEGPKYVGRIDESVPTEVKQALFAAPKPAANQRSYSGVPLGNGDFAVIAFSGTRVSSAADTPEQRRARARQLAGRAAQSEMTGYIAELQRDADIDRNPKIFQ